jgi:hypothetical protein
VLLLAGDDDPVAAITAHARRLVLEAMDAGWAGPPFDLIKLTARLGIEAIPRDDVNDARTVPISGRDVRIEYNPNRPLGRVRYSLAHEIAHTLFPDCAKQVRERARHQDLKGDEWQLEALCNIGAAEILMPFGSLREKLVGNERLDELLSLQQQYEVSTEALFIRAVRLSDARRAMFCASRVESGPREGRYRIDYSIESRTWPTRIHRGLLPDNTRLAECTAIGFTTSGTDHWEQDVLVEAVAVPPYPGSRFPRVVGVLRQADDAVSDSTANECLQVVRGSALEPRGSGNRFVVQVVNDKTANWGGAGFAQAVRTTWPEIQTDFKDWVEHRQNALRLGNARIANLPGGVTVASVIAQKSYGDSASPRVRYTALRQGLETVAKAAKAAGATIHMPKIGTGHGGGSWPVIEDIVRTTFCDAGLTVTVYELPGQKSPDRVSEQTALSL